MKILDFARQTTLLFPYLYTDQKWDDLAIRMVYSGDIGKPSQKLVKGRRNMYPTNVTQDPQVIDEINVYTTWPLAIFLEPNIQVYQLLDDLSPDMPWGVRKVAAQKLGDHRSPEALQGLLNRLPADPFWMVRCAIIQALERIGNPEAIPTLREVAKKDGFQVVRSYAAKAVERLS
jgi:hypothetical protein